MTAAEKVLQAATDRALDIINNAKQAAKHELAGEAADAKKVVNADGVNDHDLLIEMKTQLTRLIADVNEIKNGNEKRITELERSKADKTEIESLKKEVHTIKEDRVRPLENIVSKFWITMSLFTAAIAGMITVFCFHIFK